MYRHIAVALMVLTLAAPTGAQTADPEVAAMTEALQLIDQQNWDAAEASARPAGQLGLDLVEWSRLRAGDGQFADYIAFQQRHADWPGMAYLQIKGEGVIAADTPPDQVIAYFAQQDPRTASGSLALQTALQAKGRAKDADLILTSGEIAKTLGDVGVPVRVIDNFTSTREIDAALRDSYDITRDSHDV